MADPVPSRDPNRWYGGHIHLCRVGGCPMRMDCRDPECRTFAAGTMGCVRRWCDEHARVEALRAFEIIGAIMVAAQVRAYGDARADRVADGALRQPGEVPDPTSARALEAAKAALCGVDVETVRGWR